MCVRVSGCVAVSCVSERNTNHWMRKKLHPIVRNMFLHRRMGFSTLKKYHPKRSFSGKAIFPQKRGACLRRHFPRDIEEGLPHTIITGSGCLIGVGQGKTPQTALPPALPHARKHVQHIFSLYFLCDKHLNGIMLVHHVLR